MAKRTGSGLLLPVVIVVGLVAVFGGSKVWDNIEDFFSDDPVIIGAGDTAVMVASGAKSKVEQCTTTQLLVDKRCYDLKAVEINAAKMPFIARNIQLAWGEGQPYILHRNSAKQATNRAAACGKFVAKYPGGSCDEYAFATTDEGGANARTEEVPIREQRCQGGALNAGYAKAGIQQGEEFLVIISHPTNVAQQAFTGPDIAEDQTTC
ncbi:MAG: NucA/NucB deoxyribonuclease domain-containing protein [Actinophytocola sp.]|uniref:NucA/NucB deoxyribonuclease domain-containing protein n=1 Tax=Actinophytocola sp. TaxID=1872138 RepID=UPI003C782F5C